MLSGISSPAGLPIRSRTLISVGAPCRGRSAGSSRDLWPHCSLTGTKVHVVVLVVFKGTLGHHISLGKCVCFQRAAFCLILGWVADDKSTEATTVMRTKRYWTNCLLRCKSLAASRDPQTRSDADQATRQHWAHLTADTLTTILTHILSTSVAYSKLKSEIYERAADLGTQHRPAAAVIRGCLPSSLWELPYLQAVIKEGRRMSHAAAAATEPPHVSLKSPKTGDVILGFKIPGGTEVGPDVSGIMRATKYWGNDAEVFRPERWLEARDRESYPTMESALDIMWGLIGSTRPQGHDHLWKIAAETFLSQVVAMACQWFLPSP